MPTQIIRYIFLYFLFLLPAFLFAGPECRDNTQIKAVYFTDKDGLPRNIVSCFEQDEFGYSWIGTGNGISRFDGYSFINYEIFRGQIINTLIIDNKNRLWVGSDVGLYLYDRIKDDFSFIKEGYVKQISEYSDDIYFLLVNRLVKMNADGDTSIYEIEGINTYSVTKDGIWYGSGNEGIKLLGSGKRYVDGRNVSLIRNIDNVLWISCRNGDVYCITDGKLQKIRIENHQNIMDIEKINNEFWIATDGNGILILDNNLNFKKQLSREQNSEIWLPSNSVYDISHGLDNAVWISTYGAGLTLIINDNIAFQNLIPDPVNKNTLIDKEGVSVFNKDNLFFLGTNYGFSVWDAKLNKYTNFNAAGLKKQIQGSKITAICDDEKNNLWIGTYDGLVAQYTPDLKLVKTYHPCSESNNEMQQVVLMFNLDKNHILLGTHYRNKSLLKMNTATGEITPVSLGYKVQNKYNFQINSIRKNKTGDLVVLIRNAGIFSLNNGDNLLDNFVPEINSRITFKLNDFYHDKEGNYWFATQTDGLVKMSTDGRIFDKWTTSNGFPTNSLLRIESVDDSILWISTIDGLCSFDMKTKMVQIYNFRHGLASNDFLPRASSKTTDNKIIFGHSEGFSLIDPEKQMIDTSITEVIISDISFQNQSIKKLEKENYLAEPLESAKNIKLPYSRNSFTIKFFTRDNDLPKFSNYSYRLKGLEDNWIYLGENNQTTYTNLSPGKYEFQVKCTNKSNVWNEEAKTMSIIIRSPWYFSWIAILLYIFTGAILVFVSMKIYENRVHLKKELELSEFKAQKEHELTEKKLAFFTNISHDLKTPLTLISAPVNDLLKSENLESNQIKKLELVKRNASRLYKLISDLVDFRKITQNQLPLKVSEADLRPVIENIYESFVNECHKRDIEFSFVFNIERKIFADIRKIEKILWNLMANAVKFTHDGGKIWLRVETIQNPDGKLVQFQVGDNGQGIAEDDKPRIFDRFYQVHKTDNIHVDGSGIGLSIVHDLVELHHGTITVESTLGEGSTFTVRLPMEEHQYSSDERTDFTEQVTDTTVATGRLYIENETNSVYEKPENTKYNLPKMLIVEDSEELREYLASHFMRRYKVKTAADGSEGLKLACNFEPDIILTDAMMPNLNGYDFTKKVRENFNISHIPIVMLTANSATEQKIEGLTSGVDNYVTKPFEIEYLDAIASSVILNRKKLREKFIGIEPVAHETGNFSETDINFSNELMDFVLKNIANENLNIDMLVKHFAVSRTQLNRKIRALTNLTPNNYIKTIRLKKAYELIRIKGVRVAEAAYETGFTDPNYFTICFKKEFGENPSKITV